MSRHLEPADKFARYYPIDEALQNTRVRVLRVLRRFDEASADDIRIALDIEDEDRQQHNLIAQTLKRLCEDRMVKREGARCSFRYRITKGGRHELDGILARGTVAGERTAEP